MANAPVQKTASRSLATVAMGPKLIGLAAVLFVLSRVVKWLPLDWVDGPILALLWIAILGCVAAGAGLIFLKSKRS